MPTESWLQIIKVSTHIVYCYPVPDLLVGLQYFVLKVHPVGIVAKSHLPSSFLSFARALSLSLSLPLSLSL